MIRKPNTGASRRATLSCSKRAPQLCAEGTPSFSAAAPVAAERAASSPRGSDVAPPVAVSPCAAASHSGAEAFGTRKGPTSRMRRTPASAPSHSDAAGGFGGEVTVGPNPSTDQFSRGVGSYSPVGASAPSEGGRGEGNPAPIGDLSTAYDEPRSSFHAACAFDCPWHAENVPRGDFFRSERRP